MLTRNSCLSSVWTLAAVTCLSACTGTARAQDPNDPDPNEPPVILEDPQSQAVCEDWTAVFTVEAYGANLQYQWRKDQHGPRRRDRQHAGSGLCEHQRRG